MLANLPTSAIRRPANEASCSWFVGSLTVFGPPSIAGEKAVRKQIVSPAERHMSTIAVGPASQAGQNDEFPNDE
jgi:hypothetical protein